MKIATIICQCIDSRSIKQSAVMNILKMDYDYFFGPKFKTEHKNK